MRVPNHMSLGQVVLGYRLPVANEKFDLTTNQETLLYYIYWVRLDGFIQFRFDF